MHVATIQQYNPSSKDNIVSNDMVYIVYMLCVKQISAPIMMNDATVVGLGWEWMNEWIIDLIWFGEQNDDERWWQIHLFIFWSNMQIIL
jgi:hypothetical protein